MRPCWGLGWQGRGRRGDRRCVRAGDRAARSNSERATPSAYVGRRFSAPQIVWNRSTRCARFRDFRRGRNVNGLLPLPQGFFQGGRRWNWVHSRTLRWGKVHRCSGSAAGADRHFGAAVMNKRNPDCNFRNHCGRLLSGRIRVAGLPKAALLLERRLGDLVVHY